MLRNSKSFLPKENYTKDWEKIEEAKNYILGLLKLHFEFRKAFKL